MHLIFRTALVVCLIFLAACNLATPQPTATSSPTPLPSATATLTATATITNTPTPPPSETPTPTATATATATSSITSEPVTPTAAPTTGALAEWKGIPIMSGAYNGNEEGASYSYSIDTPVAKVQEYYNKEMPRRGWQIFATGTGAKDTVLLMYQKGSAMITISAAVIGGATLVVIV